MPRSGGQEGTGPGPSVPYPARTTAWLEELTAHGAHAVLVQRRDHDVVWCSDGAPDLLGLDRATIHGDLLARLAPGEQPLIERLIIDLAGDGVDTAAARICLAGSDGRRRSFLARFLDRLHDAELEAVVWVLEPWGHEHEHDHDHDHDHDVLELLGEVQAVSTDLVIVQSADLRTRVVSPNVDALLGMEGSHLLRAGAEAIHPDDRAAFIAARSRVLAGGPDERLRVGVFHADGSVRTFDVVLAGRLDEPGISGVLVVGRDISDLVATEERLARTQAIHEALVANAPDPTIAVARDATITFCSPAFERAYGHTADELVGTDAFDLFHPDDQVRSQQLFTRYLAGIPIGDPLVRIRARDGSWRRVEVAASAAVELPTLGSFVVALRDVTERVLLQHRYDRMLRDTPGTAFLVDGEGDVIWSAHGFEAYAGDVRSLTESVERGIFVPDDGVDPAAIFEGIRDGPAGGRGHFLGRLARPGGEPRWVDVTITNALDDPAVEALVVNIRDVDEARRATEITERLRRVLEHTSDVATIHDRTFAVTWGNRAANELLGEFPLAAEEVIGRLTEDSQTIMRDVVEPALVEHGTWSGEVTLRNRSGREIPLEARIVAHRADDGRLEFISTIARDISERKLFEQRLHAQARHDPLTDLPNRTLLMERLSVALESRVPGGALLFLDVDHFKQVNDTRGHEVGDRLLLEAAHRLRRAVRPEDVVARFGGDEFVVLLAGVHDHAAAAEAGERVLHGLRGPVDVGAVDVFLTASIGVAVSRPDDEAGDLVARADAAMYAAKAGGRDRVAVFTEQLRANASRRMRTSSELRAAVADGGLDVWFQPVVRARDATVMSFEALVRWNHPSRGLLLPASFLDVAEETDLIAELGRVVLERTCDVIAGHPGLLAGRPIAVNVSARQLGDPDFPAQLDALLRSRGVHAASLTLEITEDTVMQDVRTSSSALGALRTLGVGIAVDDFGTGYSSLAYLRRFPVDTLKIDREFVVALDPATPAEHRLAAGIVSLGHSLGLQVVAEGVETRGQADVLRGLGCDALQGFLYSPAVPSEQLDEVLDRIGRLAGRVAPH